MEKVEDVDSFFRLGIMVTPALVLDDEVVSTGKVLSADEIARLVRERESVGVADTTDVYLISGFLGSGKTTFLNRLVKQSCRTT